MITLIDGPCAGSYALRRAPLFLRAVKSATRPGYADALDQLDDAPADDESIYVYIRRGGAGSVHINRGGRGSGFFATGNYAHMPDVDGEQFRDNDAWQRWAEAQPYCRNCGLNMSSTLDPEAKLCADCAGKIAIRNRSTA